MPTCHDFCHAVTITQSVRDQVYFLESTGFMETTAGMVLAELRSMLPGTPHRPCPLES